MSAPLVSILIPVFNREKWIVPCVRSALAQTWPNIEVVIVDNHSTDATWSICRHFARMDPRVRIFRNRANVGPVRNWQRAMKEARGDYAKILFSDDEIDPDFCTTAAPYLEDPGVGFVFSTALIGTDREHASRAYQWRHETGTYSARSYLWEVLRGGPLPQSPGAALFRLRDLRVNLRAEIPWPGTSEWREHGAGLDLLAYLLTAANYPSIAFLAEPLVFFRTHLGSISWRESKTVKRVYRQARAWFALHVFARRLLTRAA